MSVHRFWAVLLLAGACASPAAAQGVTYTREVAPILLKRCASCHRPGEIGPFPLLTYKDAAKRARHIKEITASRKMPPWMPEPGELRFLGERRLTDTEIETLARWADSGTPEGDPKDLPPLPKFTDGWQLGQPDMVVGLPKPFTVSPDGADVYQAFVIPIPTEQVRHIKGVEFRPGNRKIVHHANLLLDTAGTLRKRAAQHDGVSFPAQLGVLGLVATTTGGVTGLTDWAPGTMPRFLPGGATLTLKPKTDLVLLIHYHPTGKEEVDQSSLGLFFSDSPGTNAYVHVSVRVGPRFGNTHVLNIPAGAKRHEATVSATLPADVRIQDVRLHAHYLLREARMTATFPDGKVLTLLEIKNWDFNWQDSYFFAEPPRLPKGTKVDLTGYFDNSADNPQNPNTPPKDVRYGPATTEEMLGTLIGVIPEDPKTLTALRSLSKIPEEGHGPVGKPRLPAGGAPIPPGAKLIREQYDKNGDGKLTWDEIEAMPPQIRVRVEQILRERYGSEDDLTELPPPKK
jgi:hypothetical protein